MSHHKVKKSYNFLTVHETVYCFIVQNTILPILLIHPLKPTVRVLISRQWLASGFLHNLCMGLGWGRQEGHCTGSTENTEAEIFH